MRNIFLAAAALCLLSSPVLAASATASASATVLQPLTVTQSQGVTFGSLNPNPSGGADVTIAMGAAGFMGDTSHAFGAHHQSTHNIAGTPNAAIAVSVPATYTLNGPGGSLTVTAISDVPAGGTGTLDASGVAQVNVGGTFVLPAGLLAGAYTGSFTITANYQ